MEIILKITCDEQQAWLNEIAEMLKDTEVSIQGKRDLNDRKGSQVRGPISPAEILVAVSTGGAFTALYKAISEVIKRNDNKGITIKIERKGGKANVTQVSVTGHSLLEEIELLSKVAPELMHGG